MGGGVAERASPANFLKSGDTRLCRVDDGKDACRSDSFYRLYFYANQFNAKTLRIKNLFPGALSELKRAGVKRVFKPEEKHHGYRMPDDENAAPDGSPLLWRRP
jgi:hypothetical protein